MTMNVATSTGITTTTIQAPSVNFVTASVSMTTPVATAPTPLTHMRHRDPAQDRDAGGEDETVALVRELPGHEAIAGQDRREPREVGIRGVGGEEQNEHGRRLHREVEDPGAEPPPRDLRHERLVPPGNDAEVVREVGDAEKHRDRDHPAPGHERRGVPPLGGLAGR